MITWSKSRSADSTRDSRQGRAPRVVVLAADPLELVRQWCRRAIYLQQEVAPPISPVDDVIARCEAALA
jgi:hypothetical protein